MKTEIIAVGTELLLGQIVNTNAQWISKQLAAVGLPTYHQTVVGDNYNRVYETFRTAHNRSDIIIVTGGLGPTEDDMTRDAAKPIFKQELIQHEPSLKKIEKYYEMNNQTMTENNRKQSLVFENAHVLMNEEGMAPGQIIEVDGRTWVFLPGVPREMKTLMNDHVFEYFKKTFDIKSEIMSEMMWFIGIGESTLEDELSDLIRNQTNPTLAPLAGEGEVGIRLTATGETDDEARQHIESMKATILNRVGSYYYGSDEKTIEETVRDLLKDKQMTIGSAESLTGGLFMERLISLPGASSVCQGSLVAYTPFTKENVIQVPKFIIREFGTISTECAEVMALNAQNLLFANVAISFTGVAGPEPSEGQEPGTVFIGVQIGERKPQVHSFHFDGTRDKIRMRAVKKGYELIYHALK
ncbi:competence/damage-inducible protein A [Halobacillus locisalis]|uniref:Putative competence-damage inducible protein n=1 Tax=Halobacillus locisalis TaxID=220753 RepID=A0A838CQC5_9BACI|nr:competence/damage-inducible protein A [Halobacillus locisalis]MBA2174039.1 competence/damage-inducible protein A [Halobacillus locisalis]